MRGVRGGKVSDVRGGMWGVGCEEWGVGCERWEGEGWSVRGGKVRDVGVGCEE